MFKDTRVAMPSELGGLKGEAGEGESMGVCYPGINYDRYQRTCKQLRFGIPFKVYKDSSELDWRINALAMVGKSGGYCWRGFRK